MRRAYAIFGGIVMLCLPVGMALAIVAVTMGVLYRDPRAPIVALVSAFLMLGSFLIIAVIPDPFNADRAPARPPGGTLED